MREFILWFFNQVGYFIETSLSWKIYGDFSLTHLLLGGILFTVLYYFIFNEGFEVGDILNISYKNAENELDKKRYMHEVETRTVRTKVGDTYFTRKIQYKYKVDRSTGERVERL